MIALRHVVFFVVASMSTKLTHATDISLNIDVTARTVLPYEGAGILVTIRNEGTGSVTFFPSDFTPNVKGTLKLRIWDSDHESLIPMLHGMSCFPPDEKNRRWLSNGGTYQTQFDLLQTVNVRDSITSLPFLNSGRYTIEIRWTYFYDSVGQFLPQREQQLVLVDTTNLTVLPESEMDRQAMDAIRSAFQQYHANRRDPNRVRPKTPVGVLAQSLGEAAESFSESPYAVIATRELIQRAYDHSQFKESFNFFDLIVSKSLEFPNSYSSISLLDRTRSWMSDDTGIHLYCDIVDSIPQSMVGAFARERLKELENRR